MNDLISVIVPAYNIDKYIERCIKSILNQTYSNLEVIVVDDGSTDNTASIIDEYALKDQRIIPVHKVNGGVSSARMEGMHRANGKWIGFVDGDDVIEANMYEILMNNAIKYNADISHCGYQMVFPDGRINYFYNTKRIKIQDNVTGVVDLLEGDLVEPGLCNKLYKKSLFKDVNLDSNIRINEDLLLNYYLFKNSKISIFEDVANYNYMIRDNSATRGKITYNKIYDPIKVKEIIKNSSKGEIKIVADKVYLRTLVYVYNSLLIDDENLKKDKLNIRKVIINNKKQIKLLNKKLQAMTSFIIYLPFLYEYVYKFYYNYILKKKY